MRSIGASAVALSLLLGVGARPGMVGQDRLLTGSYIWGDEVNEFQPCGSDSVFWVLASPQLLKRLRSAHDSLTTKPYEKVFVRVRGHRSSQPTDGFAEETNGYFEIVEIREIRRLRNGECT